MANPNEHAQSTFALSAQHSNAPTAGDTPANDAPPSSEERRTPWWQSWPFLVLVGLVVMGAIFYAIVMALSDSEPIELTPEVIVEPPAVAQVEPIEIPDPTPFQAALPTIVGTYALIGAESPELSTLDLPARAVEATVLTYSNEQTQIAARAIQHFDAEAAIAQFEAIAGESTDRAPVTVGDVQVGERATLSVDAGQTIVWRNATAVFVITGPADAVEQFFTRFPL